MFVFKISDNDSNDAVTVIMLCAVYTFAFSLYGKSLGAVLVSQSLCHEVIKPALIIGLENREPGLDTRNHLLWKQRLVMRRSCFPIDRAGRRKAPGSMAVPLLLLPG